MSRPIKKPKIIQGGPLWECSTCSRLLFASHYHKLKSAANGLRSQCKACRTASRKKKETEQAMIPEDTYDGENWKPTTKTAI